MPGRLRRVTRSYARTVVVGTVSAGLLVATLGSAAGQEATPFSNGTAKATAVVARVAPGVGNLQLGITGGVAVAEVKNTVGQAQAEAVDLGLVGSTLTAESCTGGAPIVSPSQLPQPTRVDSRGGNVSLAEDYMPLAGSALGVGRKEVAATTTPTASAVSKIAETINGLLDLQGGRAEATTRVIPGEAREAHARVSVDANIGGFLQLSGLRWDAFHRTGANPKATADFDIGTASLLGLPIPIDSLLQLEGVLNGVLAASGLTITFPKVERFTEPADVIRMTPLRIQLKDSPLGQATLGPVLNLTRVQREQLFDEIAKSICQLSSVPLLADIGINVIAGSGFLIIDIGGAEAITGELVLEDPFGKIPPITPVSGGSPLPTVPGVTVPQRSVVRPPVAPVADVGPLTEHCESAHPLRDTSCSKGALMAVGIAGLLATAAVGALDWRHQRRRRAARAAEATS